MAEEYTGSGYSRPLRRFPKYKEDSLKPIPLTPSIQRERVELDSLYDSPDNPYIAWKLKRSDIRRKIRAINPDVTDQEMEWVYDQFNLGQEANPRDFSRAQDFGGTLSRAGQLIKNNAGMLIDVSEFLIAKHITGDADEMVENHEQLEEIAFENQLIHQFQTKDMNPVTQFLFDLTVSAPTMVGVMAGGAVAGLATAKAAGALGAGAVATWIAGILGFNAVEALTEVGFNYADIMSDPMVLKKVEEALGKKMTGADQEEIRLKALEILSDRADDSAAKVAVGNFFNPLNLGHTFGAGRLAKLIKASSGKWDTAKRIGVRVSGREALEEALQSSGSQYTASEAKMRALTDVEADVSFPLRPGTIYGIDPKQVGYEALMGGFVGGPLGFAQGYRGYTRWQKGDFDLDKYGNPVRKGDPEGRIFGNVGVARPGDKNFIPRGMILNDVRNIIDIPDTDTALHNLDQYRQNAVDEKNQRKVNVIDEEIANMRQGIDLLGEKTIPERTANRRQRLNDFKPGTHAIPDPEVETTEAVVDETGETVGETTTTVSLTNLNKDPALRTTAKNIYEIPEDQRSPRDAAYIKIANENPELDNKGINAVITNMEKAGTIPKVGATQKAPVKEAGVLDLESPEAMQAALLGGSVEPEVAVEKPVVVNIPTPEGRVLNPDIPPSGITIKVDGKPVRYKFEKGVGLDTSLLPQEARDALDARDKELQQRDQEGAQTPQAPATLPVGDAASEVVKLVKSWAGQEADTGTKIQGDYNGTKWEKIRGKQYNVLKKRAEEAGIDPRDTKTGKGKARKEWDIPQDMRIALATEIANELGIDVPANIRLPAPPPKKTTAKKTTAQKATAKQEAEAQKIAEEMDRDASEGAREDAAREVPSTFIPRYNVKLLDQEGNPITPTDIDFSSQESKDKIDSLVGKTVLHYKSTKHKALDPYSLPKKLERWRFDGKDYDGNAIFTKPNKGAWKAGQTIKGVKNIRDHALNKSGKHTYDAEHMFMHLFSERGDSYSGKAKKGKFKRAFLTEGKESSAPQRVAEGKEKPPTKRTPVSEELKVLLKKAGYTEAQINNLTQEQVDRRRADVEAGVATDSIVEAMVADRKAAVTTPDKVYAETGGDIDARQAELDKIAEENRKKQEGKKAETKDKSKEDEMKEKLAADRKAKADAKKAATKVQTPVTPPKKTEVDSNSTGTITEAELRSNDKKDFLLPEKYRAEWADKLLKDERYTDLTKWDGTGKDTGYLAAEIKKDLGGAEAGVNKAYPKLMSKIRDRLTSWLIANATPDNIDALSKRYFPLIRSGDRTLVNNAIGQKGGATVNTKLTKTEKEAKEKLAAGRKEKKTLKKKSEVSEEPKQEAEPTGEPTLLNDAIKASKKVPYVKPATPNVWQIFTAEVEDIFAPVIPTESQEDLTAFVKSLGNDNTFIVSGGLKQGDAWKIYRTDESLDLARDSKAPIQLASLDPKGEEVPSFIKNALQKHGRRVGQDRAKNKFFSRKLEREDLVTTPEESAFPPSDILARIDRDQDVPLKGVDKELNKILASDKPIVWAFNTGNLVELTYMFERGKGEEPTVVNIEFSDEATAQRYTEFIKSKNPDRKKLQQADDEMVQLLTTEEKIQNDFNEAQKDTMTSKVMRNAELWGDLLDDSGQITTLEGSGAGKEKGELITSPAYDPLQQTTEVKQYTKEEIAEFQKNRQVQQLKNARENDEVQDYAVPIEGEAEGVSIGRERVEEIISDYQKEFPSSAPVTVLSDTEVADVLENYEDGDKWNIKGMFHNNRVFIVPSNIFSEQEALRVLWHENVGHWGIEKAMNDAHPDGFGGFIDEIRSDFAKEIEAMGLPVQKEFSRELFLERPMAELNSAKEFIAHHADNLFQDAPPGFFQKIADAIRKILRSISDRLGIGHVKLSESEIKDMLRSVADGFRTDPAKARKGTFLATQILHSDFIKAVEEGKNLPEKATVKKWHEHLVRLNKSGRVKDTEWDQSFIMDFLDEITDPNIRPKGHEVTRTEVVNYLKQSIADSYPYRVNTDDKYSGTRIKEKTITTPSRGYYDQLYKLKSVVDGWVRKNFSANEGLKMRDPDYDPKEEYELEFEREPDYSGARKKWRYSFILGNEYQNEAFHNEAEQIQSRYTQEEWDHVAYDELDGLEDKHYVGQWYASELGDAVSGLFRAFREKQWEAENPTASFRPTDDPNRIEFYENYKKSLELEARMSEDPMPDLDYEDQADMRRRLNYPPWEPESMWQGENYEDGWRNLNEMEREFVDEVTAVMGEGWEFRHDTIKRKEEVVPTVMNNFSNHFPEVRNYKQNSYKVPRVALATTQRTHFNVPGEIFHTRTGDFWDYLDQDYRKLRILGEVQSDLHQRGELLERRSKDESSETPAIVDRPTRRFTSDDKMRLQLHQKINRSYSPFAKTWPNKAVLFELNQAIQEPNLTHFIIPTGRMVRQWTEGKLEGQRQFYEEKLVSALRKITKPLGVDVEEMTVNLSVRKGTQRSADDLFKVNGVDLRKLRESLGEEQQLPSQPLFYSVPKKPMAAHEKFKNMGDVGAPQLEAMDAMYPTYDPAEASASSWWGRLSKKFIHKAFDPFRVVKDKVGKTEYMQARMANREDGVMNVLLKHGHVDVFQEKVDGVTVNQTKVDRKGKGLFNLLRPLGGKKSEIDRFVALIAYKRADILEKEIGEEALGIQRKHIDAALDPVNGFDRGQVRDAETGVMVSRKKLYDKMAKDLAAWNKGIVDFGIKMGLFDQESASNWNTDWYLPFFRHFEEDEGKGGPKGTRNYKSLAGQTGIKKLKGSQRALDNPLDNLVKNALHIVSASLKNDSALLTLEQATKIKDPISGQMLARRVKHPSESSLRVIKDGKDFHYEISDPMLFDALASMGVTNDFAGMGWAIKAKNMFTRITTASPVFKVRNVLRDTISAAGTTDVGWNLYKNAVGGWKELGKSEAEMLVSGAYLQFGNIRSDDPNFAQKLLTKDMRSGFIGMNPEAHDGYMNALRKAHAMGRGVWDAYQKWGDKLENANRAAVFRHHLDKGDSQLKAAFEARDLLDFTLHGGAQWVNLITSLTPFANAMLQGKYKMGRALINNPIPVVVVSSAVTMASLAEYFMYEDNEEWQRRQDWDKDMFWWINIPGTDTHFRMPKPHEFNIVANLAWRGLDMARKNDPVNGELFVSAVKSVIGREFNMSPIPQVVKPFIEVGFNKNFFFGRPIEPYRFKNMTGKEKRDLYTSETMITMSEAFDWAGVDVSPMDMEHIVEGYFGWVGEMIIGGSDFIVSKSRDFPDRPAQKLMDHPILRKMFQASPIRNTKASTAFYERMKDIEQAHADLSLSKKLQDWDRYKEIYEEKKDLLKWKGFIKKKQRILNELNKRIRVIRFDKRMGADEKRERMDQLYLLRNQIMDRIAESPALR